MAELQALQERCCQALLLLDADHRSGLGGQLECLCFGQGLPTDEADKPSGLVADRVNGEMPVQGGLHRIQQGCLRLQAEDVAQHEVVEAAGRRVEQEVPHGDNPHQLAGGIGDEAISDELALGDLAELLDGLEDCLLGMEHACWRLHHAAHGVLRVARFKIPLRRDFLGGCRKDGSQMGMVQSPQNFLGRVGQEALEGPGRRGRILLGEQFSCGLGIQRGASCAQIGRLVLVGHGILSGSRGTKGSAVVSLPPGNQ